MRRTLARLTAFSLGLLLSGSPLCQTLYKWVDEKGVTHYSESPPPGRKGQQIQVAPAEASSRPAPPPASTWQEKELEFRKRSIEREKEEEARKKKQAAEKSQEAFRKRQCQEARRALHVLQKDVPVYWQNERGQRQYVEDSDRPAAIESAKRAIELYCEPG